MKEKKSAPAAPGLSNKFIIILSALMALFGLTSIFGSTGCGDEPSTAAYLCNGNPQQNCEDAGVGGEGGSGDGGSNPGGKSCKDNPYYGKDCIDPATGKPGHYMCTSDPNSLQVVCVPDNPGSGTCLDNPLLGKDCVDVNGDSGKFYCTGTGKYNDIACLGNGSNPGTTCQQHPNYNQVCSAGGKAGHFLCPSGATTPVCTADPTNPGTTCVDNPLNGEVCAEGGKAGHFVCGSSGAYNDIVCLLDPGGGGNPSYTCATDPFIGQSCSNGVGACKMSSVFTCNPAKDGHYCPAVPGTPASTDTCGNSVDDNCNGVADEPGCTGGGGSGGSGGDGGGGGSGGTGTHGEATCTTVTSAFVSIKGGTNLVTFKNGSGSVATGDVGLTLTNGEWVSWTGFSFLSVDTSTANAKLNVWETFSPGDVTATTDILHCLQNGVVPATPANCQPTASERLDVLYHDHIGKDLGCWLFSSCPAAIVGHLPGDFFLLRKLVTPAAPLPNSNSWSGTRRGVIQMPPLCP